MRSYVVVLTGTALLAGCGNMRTETMDLASATPGDQMPGVPFTLNKPRFTIVRTPAPDGNDQYSITPSYVPDTSRRFAVSLHPAITASVDWALTLDEYGSFSDSNAKITDQTVSILSSAAKLALSVAALDRFETDALISLGSIDQLLQANFSSGSPQLYDEQTRQLRSARSAEVTAMRATWNDLLPRLREEARLGKLSDYGYRDAAERVVLLTALRLNTGPAIARANLLAVKQGQQQYAADPPRLGVVEQILAAYDSYDVARLKSLRQAAIKARTTRIAALRALNTPNATIIGDADVVFQDRVIAYSKNALATLAIAPNEVILPITEVSTSEWAARRVLDLNRQIEERRRFVRAGALTTVPGVGSDPELSDSVLSDLVRRKAVVLGLLGVHDQAVALGRVSPNDPGRFSEAQQMRSALLQQLAGAEAALITAKATPTADPPVVAEYLQASRDDAPDPQWIASRVEGRPQYVVVLRPWSPALPLVPPPRRAVGDAAPSVGDANQGAADQSGTLPPMPGIPIPPQPVIQQGKDSK